MPWKPPLEGKRVDWLHRVSDSRGMAESSQEVSAARIFSETVSVVCHLAGTGFTCVAPDKQIKIQHRVTCSGFAYAERSRITQGYLCPYRHHC